MLVIASLMSSCGTRTEIESSMAIAGDLSSISGSADSIDKYVVLATERSDFSILKPIGEETESIRSKAKEVKQRIERIMEEKAELEKELKKETKMIWVELAYQFAPLLLGIVCLVIGRLTNDTADTKFGIAMFFVGFLMTALYQTVGYWGIVCIGILSVGYFFFANEKRDLEKKMKSTTLSES